MVAGDHCEGGASRRSAPRLVPGPAAFRPRRPQGPGHGNRPNRRWEDPDAAGVFRYEALRPALKLRLRRGIADVGKELFERAETNPMARIVSQTVEELVQGLLRMPERAFHVGIVAAPHHVRVSHGC